MQYGFSLAQPLSVFSDLMHLHKPEERKQDYAADPGYLSATDIIFTPPPGDYDVAVTSRGGNYNNAWFEVNQQGVQEGKQYHLKQTFLFRNQTITQARYDKFYASVKNLLDAPVWQVAYLPQSGAAEKKLAAKANNGLEYKGQELLDQARHFLDEGSFAQALKVAEMAVAASPKNGEAFYVLGLAQGYQGQVEAANKSFLKATELGFSP